jgi:anti-sigma regulatory factor (Ser/Thr protein kinase)
VNLLSKPMPFPTEELVPISKFIKPWTTLLRKWAMPIFCLLTTYATLWMTFSCPYEHVHIQGQIALLHPEIARMYCVSTIDIGLALVGLFIAQSIYVFSHPESRRRHLFDLFMSASWVVAMWLVDYWCVRNFSPLEAMLIGDSLVMTATAFISKAIWFKRVIGVLIPTVLLTLGMQCLLSGLSFWCSTYHYIVPTCMVSADAAFAILLNAARFPGFLKGENVEDDLRELALEHSIRFSFLQDVLNNVTNGKLMLCDTADELPAKLFKVGSAWMPDRDHLAEARHLVLEQAKSAGLEDIQVDSLVISSGEALMNAVVHAKGGRVTVYRDSSEVQVWVEDEGLGISIEDLPNATLQPGWTSKDSLGLGFDLMLKSVNRLHLLTGPKGTTVVITVSKTQSGLEPDIERLLAKYSL